MKMHFLLNRGGLGRGFSLAGMIVLAGASQALVTNGSFQSGPEFYADGWTHHWTAWARTDSTFNGVGYVGSSPYGGRFVTFNEGNSAPLNWIKQDLVTVVGQEYKLRFAYGASGNDSDQRLNLKVGTLDTVFLDGTGSYNLSTLWQEVEVNFFATSTTTELLFTDVGSGGHQGDMFLDNVSVEAVPEPALLGLLGLAMARRRRDKR